MRTPIFVFTILVPAAASAGGYLIPNSNARDLALAQAAIADQHGAEAIFLNTSALAGQEGFNISAGGQVLLNRTEWSEPMLGSAELVTKASTPPALAIAYGARLENGMGWGVGVGLGVPAGGALNWPDGWQGQESIQTVSQQIFAIGVGGGFQPLPFLKVGATYLRYQSVEELHQSINYLDHYGDAALAASGGANTFGVSAEVKVPALPLSFGVSYHHSATIKLEGEAKFTGVPPAFRTLLHDQGVTADRVMPNVFFIGATYEAMPNLKIMAAYNMERWSLYKEDRFVGASGFEVVVPRDYNNAHVYRVGAEWAKPEFLPALTLRAGLLRSMSEQPGETLSPSLTDGSSWAPSIGAGYNVTRALRVDFGYQHAFFDDVTAEGEEAFPGTYKTQVDLISLGVNWRTDLGMSSGGE